MNFLGKTITFDFIKENLSLIVLFPTITGGLWQIIELWSIGIPFIRFFSATQLIADGLLILSLFVASWFIFKFMSSGEMLGRAKKRAEDKGEVDQQNIEATPLKKILSFIIISLLLILVIVVPAIGKMVANERIDIFKDVIVLFILILALRMFYHGFELLYYKRKWTLPKGEWFTVLLWILLIGIGAGCIAALFFLTKIFHKTFALPSDFKNLELIESKIRSGDSTLKKYEIRYFNDKYIFIEVTNKSDNKHIQMLPFDSLVELK